MTARQVRGERAALKTTVARSSRSARTAAGRRACVSPGSDGGNAAHRPASVPPITSSPNMSLPHVRGLMAQARPRISHGRYAAAGPGQQKRDTRGSAETSALGSAIALTDSADGGVHRPGDATGDGSLGRGAAALACCPNKDACWASELHQRPMGGPGPISCPPSSGPEPISRRRRRERRRRPAADCAGALELRSAVADGISPDARVCRSERGPVPTQDAGTGPAAAAPRLMR